MSLDDALDGLGGAGTAGVPRDGGSAEVDAVEVDRLGVRVRRVRVERTEPWDVRGRAEALPDRLRSLPERVEPQEVAPELGGAILRTRPADLRPSPGPGGRTEYFEVEVGERSAEVRRVRVQDGERSPSDFTLTREQLGRLLDELDG